MKAIDLYIAIENNKTMPKKVVYKYNAYRYYPAYKQYYREEDGNMISLFSEALCEDKVYLIEDTLKEDKKIDKLFTRDTYENNSKCIEDIILQVNKLIDRANGE